MRAARVRAGQGRPTAAGTRGERRRRLSERRSPSPGPGLAALLPQACRPPTTGSASARTGTAGGRGWPAVGHPGPGAAWVGVGVGAAGDGRLVSGPVRPGHQAAAAPASSSACIHVLPLQLKLNKQISKPYLVSVVVAVVLLAPPQRHQQQAVHQVAEKVRLREERARG